MNNKALAAVLAGGLVLATASSLWLREVRRVSRHEVMVEQLRHLQTQPGVHRGAPVPQPQPPPRPSRWKDSGNEQHRALERTAREEMLLNQRPRVR